MRKLFAMVTEQGTACTETVLTEPEYTPEMRKRTEDQFCKGGADDPVRGSWTSVTENEDCQAIFNDD